jgi:CubicO group peptidase (beta-lactamase class C family)
MARSLLAVLSLAILFAGGHYLTHRVYWDRYFAVAAKGGSGDVDVYEPTEAVGGASWTPMRPVADEARTIPADALAAAAAYAGENASTSLLIWHKGALQLAQYWNGTAADSRVNSRSLHKMLGGLTIAAAIQQGAIGSVDDPVAKYITEWEGTPKAAMTIRDVLRMSSGLMWFRGGGPFSTASRRYLDPEWERVLIEDVPLEFTPGSAYDYSDITADLMPIIVSRATGRRYADFLADAILKPIGAPGGQIWVNRAGGMPHGGCCLMLPPEAWLRIGLLVLDRGRAGDVQVLPPQWTEEMAKPSPHNPHFGLMVWLGQPFAQRRLYHRPNSPNNRAPRPGAFHSEPYLADDLVLFDGMNGQIVYIVPSRELVIVRTGLRPPRGKPEWDNSRLPNVVLRALGAEAPQSGPQPVAPRPAFTPTVGERIDAELRFWKRWTGMRRQTPRTLPGWIDVPETVRGAPDASWPGAAVAGRDLGAAGLKAAVAYAEKTRSLSLLVWRKGALQHEQYWEGFGPEDRSETYSMAKSVVGLTTGLAVADGAIGSIDDSAAKYLPAWRGTANEAITIRQLLTMSSGLEYHPFNYGPWQNPWDKGLRTFFGPHIVDSVLAFGGVRVPGATFAYNSANTQALLAVIERATGERYADYVSRRLWQPLGAAPAQLWLDRPGGSPRAYAYFQARPRDWLRLGVMIAQGGRFDGREIVPASWIAAMTTPAPRNPNYGFQVWLGAPADGKRAYNADTPARALHSAPYLAPDVAFFDGGGGHRVYIVPSRELVIVRTGAVNRPDWDDAVLPNALLADLPP